MAFTASTLMRTINETSMYGYVDNTVAHEFIGESMSAVTSEIQFGIMSEAADFMDLVSASDDLLAEAAISSPDSYDILQENVLTSIKNGLLKFWKKIKEFVKGLIEKLKAAFYRLTGKTDKWVSLMRPKISEAARRGGSSDFKYEMFAFDEKYILTDMSSDLTGIMNDWDDVTGSTIKHMETEEEALLRSGAFTDYNATDTDPKIVRDTPNRDVGERMKQEKEAANAEITRDYKNTSADSQKVKDKVAEGEKIVEELERNLEDWNDNFPASIGKHFGVSGATTMENLWSEVKEKAHGGTTEKSQQTIGGKVNGMLSAIENSKKTIDNLKKVYEGHLRALTKFESAIEKSGYDVKVKDESKNNIPGPIVRIANDVFKATYSNMMKQTQAYETAMNSARQLNISLIEEMTGSYMSALTAFAGYKEPKKEK